jgi:hypothetical protein
MKHVEPFIKFDPVLDYETPTPPKSSLEKFRESCEPFIDAVGGTGPALFIGTVAFIGFGMSLPGRIGGTMVLFGGYLLHSLLRYWAKSSRW